MPNLSTKKQSFLAQATFYSGPIFSKAIWPGLGRFGGGGNWPRLGKNRPNPPLLLHFCLIESANCGNSKFLQSIK